MIWRQFIDLVRITCCLFVVLAHCMLVSIHQSPVPVDSMFSVWVEQIVLFIRWVVPVFFIITGYCIAKKKTCTYSYCFLHVLKFIEVLFTVGLFFAIIELVFIERTLNGFTFVKALGKVVSGQLWDHMWFVYTVIGIYLVLPVIHCFLQQDIKSIITITTLLFIFTILIPYLDKWIHIGIRFPFEGVLFYVFFGGAVAKINTKKNWRYIYSLILALCMVYMVFFLKIDNWENIFHPVGCLMSMNLFLLWKEIYVKPSKVLLILSGLSWGVYLIHPFFINVAVKGFRINLVGSLSWLKILIFFCTISLLSFGTVYILKKIPMVKQLF